MISYIKKKLAAQEALPADYLMKGRNLYYFILCEYYSRMNALCNKGYGDWDKIISINPEQIEYITYADNNLKYGHRYLNVGAFDRVKHSGAIVNGSWDKKKVEFETLYIFQSVYGVHKKDLSWEDTCYFESIREAIKNGASPKGCTSVKDIQELCEQIGSLLDKIQREGYKSQREMGKVPVSEVTVNVGRDGELLFNDGRHRLSIAKVLGIDKIPVRILAIHEKFSKHNPGRLKHTNINIE